MHRPRTSSICLLALGVITLSVGGCQTHGFAWRGARQLDASHATSGSTSAAADVAPLASDARPGSKSAGDDEEMAAVLDDLQQVGRIDPAAQQTLVEQLRNTAPAMRPLVAQQFCASLAYHQQLMAQSAAALPATTATGGPPDRLAANDLARPDASASEPIGSLVDPRGLRGDPVYEQALAEATPAAIPVPGLDAPRVAALAPPDVPLAFADQASASAAAEQLAAAVQPVQGVVDPSTATSPAPVRASFEQAGGEPQVVQPAVLHTLGAAPAPEAEHPHPGPLPKGEGGDWRQLVDEAAADLARRVPDSPQSTAEVHQHVSLRILELLAGHTEEALRPIPGISPAEQEYWSAQLFELATYLDHHAQPDDKRRAAAAAVHLDEALAHLRELSSLSLRNLAFCKQVYDYGVYEPCDGTSFAPGQQISLYAEVENYRSESTEKGYSTSLGTSYNIVNDKDELVDGGQFPDVQDCCRSRRRDFHIQYGLTLPKNISPGEYRLELVVKDRLGDKIGRGSIPLKIGGSRP
jgi:hypothetical protein